MADNVLLPVVLSELIDSDNEKPRRGETRNWLKRREEFGIYHTLILIRCWMKKWANISNIKNVLKRRENVG